MKAFNILIPLVLTAIAAGCKSHEARAISSTGTVSRVTQIPASAPLEERTVANDAPQQIVTDKAVYTIKVLPNPRLSATSREGDKSNEVYSSNIIAVYVHPRNGVTVNSTNSSAAPSAGNNPAPQNQ